MTDVTPDRVYQVYALMWDNIDLNVGVVILSMMKKMCYY